MNKANYTPAPWRYQENSDAYTHIVRAGDRHLCSFAQDVSGEAEANARLTAAAPELLKACEWLIQFAEQFAVEHNEGPTMAACIGQARNAIAKAKGQQ